jgi:hypothetical protein
MEVRSKLYFTLTENRYKTDAKLNTVGAIHELPLPQQKLDPRLLEEVGDLDTAHFHKSNRIAIYQTVKIKCFCCLHHKQIFDDCEIPYRQILNLDFLAFKLMQ